MPVASAWTLLVSTILVTAPRIAIVSPPDGTTTSASTIDVTARVDVPESSRIRVTCNGRPAVLRAGALRCVVPLEPGVNAVVVHAMDAGRNGTSAGVRVVRKAATSITLYPSAVTIHG